jgi:Putative Flp pilus-assembly TadE/G-like
MPAHSTRETPPQRSEWLRNHAPVATQSYKFPRKRDEPPRLVTALRWTARHLRQYAAPILPALGCRGVTSVALAGSAAVLLGFAGLAVDAGSWYLSLRQATTAADLAALAGSAARERGADYVAVARNTAALNGFPNAAEVTVQPPASGNFVGDSTAVEVIITRTQSMSLARLFLTSAPQVRSRAVASAHLEDEVCVLALGIIPGRGGLELGGHSTTSATTCTLGSGADGISVDGSARVQAAGLITTGSCSGCQSNNVSGGTSGVAPLVVANRPNPIPDPFASLQNWTPQPDTNPANCIQIKFNNNSASISPGTICQNLKIQAKQTLNLSPGIYYFNNASLEVAGQATINGDGVTLVFTGDPNSVGSISIDGGAQGHLTGPTSSLITGYDAAKGLVMYRIPTPTSGPVKLDGNDNMQLFGGLYFPTSDVTVNGKAEIASACLSIVANDISISGNADTTIGVSGCKGFTPYPTIRTVRLVE